MEPGAGGYEDLLDDDYDNERVRTDINPARFQFQAKSVQLPYDSKYTAAPPMPFKEVSAWTPPPCVALAHCELKQLFLCAASRSVVARLQQQIQSKGPQQNHVSSQEC